MCSVEGAYLGLGSISHDWDPESHYLVHFMKLGGWGCFGLGSWQGLLECRYEMSASAQTSGPLIMKTLLHDLKA